MSCGPTPSSSPPNTRSRSSDWLSDGSVDVNNTNRYIALDEFEKRYKHFAVESGDIVVASSGNTYGKVGRIARGHLPLMMNTSVIRFHPLSNDTLDAGFLYAFLRSPLFRDQVEAFVIGSAQPNFGPSHLKRMVIPSPGIALQRKIAAILSAYDDLIENNQRRIKILEEMAQNLYREWFVKFRFPGHEQVRMVDSPLGKIPEGWEATVLGDLADQARRGIRPESVGLDTPYVGLEHIPRKSIALAEWDTVEKVKSTKLRFVENEILFGKIRPYFHKVAVAPLDGICSSDTIVIKARSLDYWGLVLGCVSSEEFVAHATQTSQGTKMPRANWDVMTKYPLALPPSDLLTQFNQLMRSGYRLIRNLVFKNKTLRQTRDLLLPKLISGELDVSNLDINIGEQTP